MDARPVTDSSTQLARLIIDASDNVDQLSMRDFVVEFARQALADVPRSGGAPRSAATSDAEDPPESS